MAKKKRYSYIKNPFSVNGWYCFALGALALVLTIGIIVCSVIANGNVSLFMAATGFSAILLDVMGLVFLMTSLREKDRNHLFALIGGVMELAVLVAWVSVLAL